MTKEDLNKYSTLFVIRDLEPWIIRRDNFISILGEGRIPTKLIFVVHVGQ